MTIWWSDAALELGANWLASPIHAADSWNTLLGLTRASACGGPGAIGCDGGPVWACVCGASRYRSTELVAVIASREIPSRRLDVSNPGPSSGSSRE